jgi:hypothetical protein
MVGKELWEIVKEGFTKALAKSNLEWIEHTFGLKTGKFAEHVAVEVVAALLVVTIIALASFLASRGLWRALRLKFRAATIQKTAGTSFVIVRCPIANDSNDAIGNEISGRLETAFRAFAGWGEAGRPFHVMEFPLPLSGDDGTKVYDRAIETAKRWLEKTNGNILIWGKRVKGESVGIIRLIGKDREKGVIEVRRVDFDKRAKDFDQALSNAIAYEAAQLTQVALSEPELVRLEVLREISSKLKRLASSDAPALSNKWRERMSDAYWRLTDEIVRRTPDSHERDVLEAEARLEFAGLDPSRQAHRFAEVALRIATLVQKKNWIDPKADELDEAYGLIDKAIPILTSLRANRHAAEAELERIRIRALQSVLPQTADRKVEAIAEIDFDGAVSLAALMNDGVYNERLEATRRTLVQTADFSDIYKFETMGPKLAVDFIQRVAGYLDNGELIDLCSQLNHYVFFYGDRYEKVEFWRASSQILEMVLKFRSSWTPDERRLLKAMISHCNIAVAQRLFEKLGSDAAAPYFDRGHRLGAEVVNSLDWEHLGSYRWIDLRTIADVTFDAHLFPIESDVLDRYFRIMRLVIGPSGSRFPEIQMDIQARFVVALNNYAERNGSLEIAKEALSCALDLKAKLGDRIKSPRQYAAAFSVWLVAKLTPQADSVHRIEQGRKARTMAEQALKQAMEEGYRAFASSADELLRSIESDFPELKNDVEAGPMAEDAHPLEGRRHDEN